MTFYLKKNILLKLASTLEKRNDGTPDYYPLAYYVQTMSSSFGRDFVGTTGVNNEETNEYRIIYYLKEALKERGWVVKGSGSGDGYTNQDGYAYDGYGDVITKPGPGRNGWQNAGAWFVIECPPDINNVKRQFLFKLIKTKENTSFSNGGTGTNGLVFRHYIVYSYNNSFNTIGAGVNFNTAPINPSGSQVVVNQDLIFRDGYYINAFVGAGDNDDGYSWFIFGLNQDNPQQSVGFMAFDNLKNTSINDADPYVFWKYPQDVAATGFNENLNLSQNRLTQTSNILQGWIAKGLTYETWCIGNNLKAFRYVGSTNPDGYNCIENVGSNPNAEIDTIPVFIGRGSGFNIPKGIKGISRIIKWHSSNRAQNGEAITVNTTNDSIVVDSIVLPWDGSYPII
jgi:hypothetical protein